MYLKDERKEALLFSQHGLKLAVQLASYSASCTQAELDGQIKRQITDVTEAFTGKQSVEHADCFIILSTINRFDQLRQSKVVDSINITSTKSQ